MTNDINKSLEIIKHGTIQVTPEADLLKKLSVIFLMFNLVYSVYAAVLIIIRSK